MRAVAPRGTAAASWLGSLLGWGGGCRRLRRKARNSVLINASRGAARGRGTQERMGRDERREGREGGNGNKYGGENRAEPTKLVRNNHFVPHNKRRRFPKNARERKKKHGITASACVTRGKPHEIHVASSKSEIPRTSAGSSVVQGCLLIPHGVDSNDPGLTTRCRPFGPSAVFAPGGAAPPERRPPAHLAPFLALAFRRRDLHGCNQWTVIFMCGFSGSTAFPPPLLPPRPAHLYLPGLKSIAVIHQRAAILGG